MNGWNTVLSVEICWSYIDKLVSGVPILQNSKLIGAVTRVLVDDTENDMCICREYA